MRGGDRQGLIHRVTSPLAEALLFIVLAPLIGMGVGLLVMNSVYFSLEYKPSRSIVVRLCISLLPLRSPYARRQRRAEDTGHHRWCACDGVFSDGSVHLPIPFWVSWPPTRYRLGRGRRLAIIHTMAEDYETPS